MKVNEVFTKSLILLPHLRINIKYADYEYDMYVYYKRVQHEIKIERGLTQRTHKNSTIRKLYIIRKINKFTV